MTSANSVDPASIRERILDAAELCLVENGYNTRLHAVIAQRAGFSRPTLYKYFGDQSAIVDALFQRELTKYLAVLDPILRGREKLLEVGFVDAIVYTVIYARDHELLQKGLRDSPEIVLPWFTTRSKPIVEVATGALTPHFERLFTPEQLAKMSPRAISEWAFRIIASLITTDGIVDTADEQALRSFVKSLLSIAFLPPPDQHRDDR